MEQKFFESVCPEQLEKTAELMKQFRRDEDGKTREGIKDSYSRRLTERLRELEKSK